MMSALPSCSLQQVYCMYGVLTCAAVLRVAVVLKVTTQQQPICMLSHHRICCELILLGRNLGPRLGWLT